MRRIEGKIRFRFQVSGFRFQVSVIIDQSSFVTIWAGGRAYVYAATRVILPAVIPTNTVIHKITLRTVLPA